MAVLYRIFGSGNSTLAVTNIEGADASVEVVPWLPLCTVGNSATGAVGLRTIGIAQGAVAAGVSSPGNPVYVAGLNFDAPYAPAGTQGTVAPLAINSLTGRLYVQAMPEIRATAFGTTKFRSIAITNTPVAVKASAGNLYAWNITNLHSAAIYVKFFDAATGSVTPGTTAPVFVVQVAATGQVGVRGSDLPVNFGTAITVLVTTVGTDSGTQTAAATLPLFEAEYV